MAKLALKKLCRRFPGTPRAALDDLTLNVKSGELLVLVGPSGCGKSTALRLIAGLDAPDGGAVHIDGRDVSGVPPQDRDVAMVFQGYALYPHLTARQIIEFPLKMRKVGAAERAKSVDEAAEMLSLTPLLNRRPAELSGGERQRVAMGRAIVRKPKVFLFDEPLSNLDAALRGALRVELVSLLRRIGATAIYVTHDQTEAMTMGDRIAVLQAGRLIQVGTPRALYEQPDHVFIGGFIGTPPMNLVPTRSGKAGAPTALGTEWPLGLGGAMSTDNGEAAGDLTVGFRPEHVRLSTLSDGGEERVTLRGELEATEPLGAETYAYFNVEGKRICARVPGFYEPDDTAATLTVEKKHLHWFQTDGGRATPGRISA